jgi:hypothetical protein
MRRIVLSLALLGAVSLGSCSGGGSVLSINNGNNVDRVIITTTGGTNIARVLPGASIPLSAVSVSGSQNGFLSNNNYRWSAALTIGQQYPAFTDGQMKPCANVTLTGGAPPATSPYSADFSIYIAIDPVNEANIIFNPPQILPLPAGFTSITPNFPYCVTVNAQPGKITGSGLSTTFIPTGQPGSITVVVVNPQSPLS